MTEMEYCPFCGCGTVEMDEYERFKCLGCGVLVKFPDSPIQRANAYHGLVIDNYDRVWHVEHWNTRAEKTCEYDYFQGAKEAHWGSAVECQGYHVFKCGHRVPGDYFERPNYCCVCGAKVTGD